jgi:hypothetical protein
MTLPATGLHYGVSFEDYSAWDAVNISRLKPIDDSPLHCRWAMDHPKESDEMDVGSALHVRTFEPSRFDKEFYIGSKEYNATTKEGKALKSAELAEAAGRTYIRRKPGEAVDGDSVEGMSEALRSHARCRRFLDLPGQCEVSVLWKDESTGLLCKGRFDKLTTTERPIIVEVKSVRGGHARIDRFCKEVGNWRYHSQASYYCNAVKTLTGKEPLHVFLIVENVAPYAANWGMLDDERMVTGAELWRKWLDEFAECQKASKWPGYPELIDNNTPMIRNTYYGH